MIGGHFQRRQFFASRRGASVCCFAERVIGRGELPRRVPGPVSRGVRRQGRFRLDGSPAARRSESAPADLCDLTQDGQLAANGRRTAAVIDGTYCRIGGLGIATSHW